jgi:hypothetical protein
MKNLRTEIKNFLDGVADRTIGSLHINKIGTKFVRCVNLYNPSKWVMISLDDFYNQYVK